MKVTKNLRPSSHQFTIAAVVLLAGIFACFQPTPAQAVTIPAFPSCNAPSGITKVAYDQGIHGIAGRTQTYEGSDIVYIVNEEQLLQCYCPVNSDQGIQTWWMKANHLNQDEISILEHEGWVFIPNGSLWGLTDDPYMAGNKDYTCRNQGGSSGSSGSSSGQGGSSNPINQILGVSALAATGLHLQMIGVTTGITLILAALYQLFKRDAS